jgi:hypothetical protein
MDWRPNNEMQLTKPAANERRVSQLISMFGGPSEVIV